VFGRDENMTQGDCQGRLAISGFLAEKPTWIPIHFEYGLSHFCLYVYLFYSVSVIFVIEYLDASQGGIHHQFSCPTTVRVNQELLLPQSSKC
jgi:hypothetical protein